jgi:hypothetical protein
LVRPTELLTLEIRLTILNVNSDKITKQDIEKVIKLYSKFGMETSTQILND